MADEQKPVVTEEEPPGVTVEIEPYGDKPGKPELSDEEVEKLDSLPAEDEITKYARDAQKRIKGLHIANQEWRRRSVQSDRNAAAATNLANQLFQENQQLKRTQSQSEQALIEQALQRAEAQLAQAEQRFLVARQSNDAAQELVAQKEIAQAIAERDRLRLLRPTPVRDGEPNPPRGEAPAPPAAAAPGTVVPGQPPPVEESEAFKSWRKRNPWFQATGEEKMTGYAFGVHNALAAQGLTEASNSREYWAAIDREMRAQFPARFADKEKSEAAGGRPVAVAGATRVNGGTPEPKKGPRHVVLTESQVALAKSLGLTNEQYAMQLVKDEGLQEGSYHDISTKRQ